MDLTVFIHPQQGAGWRIDADASCQLPLVGEKVLYTEQGQTFTYTVASREFSYVKDSKNVWSLRVTLNVT